jgi:nitrate reductase assembly molybdenum cofactor insertion protein NarJ
MKTHRTFTVDVDVVQQLQKLNIHNLSKEVNDYLKSRVLDFASENEKQLSELQAELDDINALISVNLQKKNKLQAQIFAIENRIKDDDEQHRLKVYEIAESMKMAGGVANFTQ